MGRRKKRKWEPQAGDLDNPMWLMMAPLVELVGFMLGVAFLLVLCKVLFWIGG